MADERVTQAVKIVDPTTTSQEAAVDASGNVQVILAANDGVDVGDVDVTSIVPGTGATNLGKAEDAAHTTGDTGVMSLAVRNDTLAALGGTDGDYAPLQVNASGALYIQEGAALDVSGATVTVDLGANNDVTIDNSSIVLAEDAVHNTGDAGVMSLAVRNDTLAALAGADGDYAPLQVDASGALYIQEGSALDVSAANVTVVGAAADGATLSGNPVLIGGGDGTNAQIVTTDSDGHLQVDVLTGGGTDSPTNPTVDTASSSGTAAGASANLDSSEITEAEKLWAVDVTGSVAFKAELQLFENDVATTLAVMFGQAGETVRWNAPHRDFAEHAGASAGTDTFRVVWTNMDTSQAADGYCSFYYST